MSGRGVPQNPGRAVPLLRRACDVDDFRACRALAMEMAANPNGEEDLVEAMKLATRACDHGDLGGCTMVGIGAAHAASPSSAVEARKSRRLIRRYRARDGARSCAEDNR